MGVISLHVLFALRVIMEPVVVTLKLAVLFLLTVQLGTGESTFISQVKETSTRDASLIELCAPSLLLYLTLIF